MRSFHYREDTNFPERLLTLFLVQRIVVWIGSQERELVLRLKGIASE